MIDYYKGVDTKTGFKILYLKEVTLLINQAQSADEIFTILGQLDIDLEARSINGNLSPEGKILSEKIPKIKKLFLDEETKIDYDNKLEETYFEIECQKIEKLSQLEEVEQSKEISQSFVKNKFFLVFLGFSILFLIGMVLLLKISIFIVIIYLLLIVILFLLGN